MRYPCHVPWDPLLMTWMSQCCVTCVSTQKTQSPQRSSNLDHKWVKQNLSCASVVESHCSQGPWQFQDKTGTNRTLGCEASIDLLHRLRRHLSVVKEKKQKATHRQTDRQTDRQIEWHLSVFDGPEILSGPESGKINTNSEWIMKKREKNLFLAVICDVMDWYASIFYHSSPFPVSTLHFMSRLPF